MKARPVHLRDNPRVLLTVEDLVVEFPADRGRVVSAVAGVSFDVLKGETLGLVGESGCGKSTTGLAIVQLLQPTAGRILFGTTELTAASPRTVRNLRPRFQAIFQDPLGSLNPRRTVRKVLREPIEIWPDRATGASKELADELLDSVGLDATVVGDRRPHELSGGQAQRVCIARALVLQPDLLVCDEPVSSLDVSVQAQILNLLEDLKARYDLTLVFIAHDLAVIKNISDRVAVMYLGKLCEIGDVDTVFSSPAHPYTTALLRSVPDVERVGEADAPPLAGEVPSPLNPPSGCRFRTRCPRATDVCAVEEPPIRRGGPDHFAACHHPLIPLDPPAPTTAGVPKKAATHRGLLAFIRSFARPAKVNKHGQRIRR